MNTDTRPPINIQWLERMRATKPMFLRALFGNFLDEEPKRLAALSEAVAKADMEQVRYLAHSLKGAAATLGMERLRDVCRELEFAAKDSVTDAFPAHLGRIDQEMSAVFAVMRLELPSL
jgi:histidine phosphotransfer protein HptB